MEFPKRSKLSLENLTKQGQKTAKAITTGVGIATIAMGMTLSAAIPAQAKDILTISQDQKPFIMQQVSPTQNPIILAEHYSHSSHSSHSSHYSHYSGQ